MTTRACAAGTATATELPALTSAYRDVRRLTHALCEPLATEDYVIQSMPDASPVKWHLAHTTWFFETFVLGPFAPGYRAWSESFSFLFNSYYNAVGDRWPRSQRGLLSRPTVDEVFRYRAYVDQEMERFLGSTAAGARHEVAGTVILGLNHEQQHQELIVTDLKHLLAANPLRPIYRETAPLPGAQSSTRWLPFARQLASIGHASEGFAFDNESPRHQVFLPGFQLAHRLATNGAFLEFIADDGYARPELWLSDGWATCQSRAWSAPLYWEKQGDGWIVFTLAGPRPVDPAEPVCHVSYYEADAFARWAGARLPTEAEWEVAAAAARVTGHFLEGECFHPAPRPAADDAGPALQLYGDVWQWTASPYVAYPGYQPMPGALGEYNGKFMCNQIVLRGASCATPRSHARRTYRNFFGPDARWQFSGIRLAKDLA